MSILLCVCYIVLVVVSSSGGVIVAFFMFSNHFLLHFLLFFVPVFFIFSLIVLIMETLFYTEANFKACVCYFLINFYLSPNDSTSKTVKDVFYFI